MQPPFYSLIFIKKNINLTKVAYFWKTNYCTYFQGTRLSGASVAPTPQVRAFTMLLLLIVGNQNERRWGGFEWYNPVPDLMKIGQIFQKLKGRGDT
jgi:hypothetical protein